MHRFSLFYRFPHPVSSVKPLQQSTSASHSSSLLLQYLTHYLSCLFPSYPLLLSLIYPAKALSVTTATHPLTPSSSSLTYTQTRILLLLLLLLLPMQSHPDIHLPRAWESQLPGVPLEAPRSTQRHKSPANLLKCTRPNLPETPRSSVWRLWPLSRGHPDAPFSPPPTAARH